MERSVHYISSFLDLSDEHRRSFEDVEDQVIYSRCTDADSAHIRRTFDSILSGNAAAKRVMLREIGQFYHVTKRYGQNIFSFIVFEAIQPRGFDSV